ncbi:MAG: alpha/beta fold hydrolase, partial [Verrucomicrobiaceae bacterium]|nr:alpha/beta fold hydrolase [Verrucomicrobiaceae bacterium]
MHDGTALPDEHPFISRIPEFLRDLGVRVPTRLESSWAAVEGVRLHSRGSKTPLPNQSPFILIHGLVISSLYMIPLAECLAIHHPVHALDLPGFGRSAAPERVLSVAELANAVIAWMDVCGIARCHLVGNSLGCEIAAHAAVKEPERIASLTLIGPTLDPDA